MLKKGLIVVFALIGFAYSKVQAQENGNVVIVKDTLITILQHFRANMGINPIESKPVAVPSKPVVRSAATRRTVRGFRVQIFAGSNRSNAFSEQARFRSMYKDIDTYINYDEPNYRVKVGDFRSRSEANNFMNLLRQQFKNVFVFSENVFVYQ
ncbi:SPOR domain-containing protein [Sphingobacterium sp. SRCM116780]|uniref:SPOR domain-containing protein n=1 Tax=Sphingobacterium sp. SRCM116780 TaxID=2907623 RepID=UPI001F375648|nr:SPOR domain-containing protein [Sphingobacterium sp. SRCM116780]UIR55716.1 SPOR domain-containing protein [Sphingobacterium sp. SRCM116780]